MPIEDAVVRRITELLAEAQSLRRGSPAGQVLSEEHAQDCRGWLAAATNIVQRVVPDPNSAYRRSIEKIADSERGFCVHESVGEVSTILANLLRDAKSGLVSSVADHARAEVFDDFLDHAKAYLHEGRKDEAGVIAGVVFEDSLRRVCRKQSIPEQGVKLDELISELRKHNTLSATKAKRARVSADVRTKATHAQWDEFDQKDVETTIRFTDEFIAAHVED